MGIGITSNLGSIPPELERIPVSIPNGDRHYLELCQPARYGAHWRFQSPMGIGITSNFLFKKLMEGYPLVSIPNGDRHYLEHFLGGVIPPELGVSIPNGDRHYLEPKI